MAGSWRSVPVLLAMTLTLGACGLPTPLIIASYAAEAVSLVETGKTLTDHAISAALHEDCRLFRIVSGEPVCVDEGRPADEGVQTVMAELDLGPVPTVAPEPAPAMVEAA